jgi:hypothetical protein
VKITASTIDITPVRPAFLGGNEPRKQFTTIAERLEANIAVLCSDSHDDPIVIISLDLLYPGRILRATLEAALPELRPEQIFLAASHTHQAPMTDDTKIAIGTPDPQYIHTVARNLSREIRQMIYSDRTQIGILSTSAATARHSVNRRLKRRLQISRNPTGPRITGRIRVASNVYVLGPNPDGVTDEVLSILISRSPSGRAQFVIWNYACHPVDFPDESQIAAHYPHYVREILRSSLGVANLPVLFLQGFSGNTRPSASAGETTGLRSRVRRWLFGAPFTGLTWRNYVSWATDLGELVAVACANSTPLDDEALRSRRNISCSSSFVKDAAEPSVSFHAIRLGSDFTIIGVSAEVVAEFAPTVRMMTGSKRVMCVGCLDHPFGYAPTKGIMHEGGYEGGDYCQIFGLGALVENVEEEILQGFRSVL